VIMMQVRTLAIDFDGVIHQYAGWQGESTFNAPVPGAKEALETLHDAGWILIVHTCRRDTLRVQQYLRTHGIPFDFINENPFGPADTHPKKLYADIYLDDRAVRFTGSWTDALEGISQLDSSVPREQDTHRVPSLDLVEDEELSKYLKKCKRNERIFLLLGTGSSLVGIPALFLIFMSPLLLLSDPLAFALCFLTGCFFSPLAPLGILLVYEFGFQPYVIWPIEFKIKKFRAKRREMRIWHKPAPEKISTAHPMVLRGET
jgi:hypothetical protein